MYLSFLERPVDLGQYRWVNEEGSIKKAIYTSDGKHTHTRTKKYKMDIFLLSYSYPSVRLFHELFWCTKLALL